MLALVWAYSNAIIGQLYASEADEDGEPPRDSTPEDDSPGQIGT
jgi:hypothetical protein